ncbi:DUF1883 domain-containing protein [Sorangium sp. So ce118]
MDFIKYELRAGPNDIIEVKLDSAANVRLLDYSNFQSYRMGRAYRCVGYYVKKSPFHLRPSRSGHWYVVIDLGGYAGTIRAVVRVLHGAANHAGRPNF